jgi:hypothetical protein
MAVPNVMHPEPVEITSRLTTGNFLGGAQVAPSRFSGAMG